MAEPRQRAQRFKPDHLPIEDENYRVGLMVAHELDRRLKRRGGGAPIRNGFVARSDDDGQALPPLARILRSGRGSDVRLKVELSILWCAVREPYTVRDPARTWSALIGLGAGETAVRQSRSALSWLERNQLLTIGNRLGDGRAVLPLDETGTGNPYEPPNIFRIERGSRDRYIKLPNSFWTNGWVQILGGPAIAMLLILEYMQKSQRKPRRDDDIYERLRRMTVNPSGGVWASLDLAHRRFALTDDTRYKGLNELHAWGLVTSQDSVFSTRIERQRRVRKVHQLHLDRLDKNPWNNEP